MHILHTVLLTFPKRLTRRICIAIKNCFGRWSPPLFSRPSWMIQGGYGEEKIRCLALLGAKRLRGKKTPLRKAALRKLRLRQSTEITKDWCLLIIQHYNERNAFFSTLHLIVSSLGYFHSFCTCQICSYDCSLIATLLLKVLHYLGIISVSLNLFLMYTSNALVQNIMMSWFGKKYAPPAHCSKKQLLYA